MINSPDDLGCLRRLLHLDELQAKARDVNARLLDTERVGQGCVLASPAFERVAQSTLTEDGRRSPALRFGDPRVMALLGALCIGLNALGFTNRSLRAQVSHLLGVAYTVNQASYDLARLRLNGLITRRTGSNTYDLTPDGQRVAIFYTKVHDRLLRPLIAADQPTRPDRTASRPRHHRPTHPRLHSSAHASEPQPENSRQASESRKPSFARMDRHFCTAHLQRGLERRRCFASGSASGDRLGMRAAYHADSALEAQALLEALAAELDKTHPGAAGSLREGLAETLTVLRLGVPPTLARTLRSTNAIESMIWICRDHASNVKRWRDGQMALRWCAAGMVEASKQFRRVNGHLHLPPSAPRSNGMSPPKLSATDCQ